MSAEAIKLITGIGESLLGRVTTYDALTGRFRELEYEAIPDAAPVTTLPAPAASTGLSFPSTPTAMVTPLELAGRLSSGEPLQLIDVREPFEREIASIRGAELIPLGAIEHTLASIRTDIPVVVYCHHGSRARQAVAMLERNGHRNIEQLEGGIDAYARVAEPTLARY
jgi:adenylyltransferase/sulfurtransferase